MKIYMTWKLALLYNQHMEIGMTWMAAIEKTRGMFSDEDFKGVSFSQDVTCNLNYQAGIPDNLDSTKPQIHH